MAKDEDISAYKAESEARDKEAAGEQVDGDERATRIREALAKARQETADARQHNVWKNVFNPVSEDSEPRFVAYRLRLRDGRDLTLPLSYRNMLDPYAAIGPLLTAILPSPVAQTLPAHLDLGQLFERYIVQRKLPEMLQAFRGGHPVDFGELRLDSIGLSPIRGGRR